MAITARLYGQFPLSLCQKLIDYINDSITVTLHTSGYTPDQDAHVFASSLTSEVAAGGGYTTGGKALTGKTLTYTSATNITTLAASNVQWAASTITARTAVIKDDTPATAATKPLIGYQQSDVDIVSTGGNFDLTWNASGLAQFTVA